MSSKTKPITHNDERLITRGELRMDLEKHAQQTVNLVRDSMTEVMQLLYLVLGEEAIDRAIKKAQLAEEVAHRTRMTAIEARAQSPMEDMARANLQAALTLSSRATEPEPS